MINAPYETTDFITSEAILNDPTQSLLVDFSEDSDTMVVAFAGFAQQIGLPPFEFFTLLNQARPTKKIFLRDTYSLYYQHGVQGIADDPQGIVDYVQLLIAEQKTTKLITLGNSVGGFAALLFGALLDADRVLSIAPPTVSSYWLRVTRYNEWRWLRTVYSKSQGINWFGLRHLAWTQGWKKHTYPDLAPVLLAHPQTEYHVYFPEHNRTDRLMAKHLESVPHVRLYPYDYDKHSLVKHLKSTGQLQKLLEEILSFEK